MENEAEVPPLITKPEEEAAKQTSILRTIISLALFIVLDYWVFKSWAAVFLLVTVIFIHEAGHFIAMKFFGYKSVNMTFVPFVGAYVSGQATNLSQKNKLIVLLAGPLPGIILGCIFLLLYQNYHTYFYFQIAIIFLLLNVFNLLPVFPLDGGQFFQTLFFNGSRILQVLFLYLSCLGLLFLFYKLNYEWLFLAIVPLILIRINTLNFITKIRKILDEQGFDYACTYEDLSDEEYWQIRTILLTESKVLGRKYTTLFPSNNEQPIIKKIESILVPAYDDDLTSKSRFFFVLIWAIAFCTPITLWLNFNKHLNLF